MKYGQIPFIEQPVSRLVMGSVMLTPEHPELTDELLGQFIAAGGNTIDTAHVYGMGKVEQAVGQWLERRNRSSVLIIGKGAHHDASGKRVTPQAITADLLVSLERLRTDHVDLYLLHRDDPTRPVGEIVECLNEHHEAGRIRAFGGSNWSTRRIDEANAYAQTHDLVPFVAGSPNFSLGIMKEAPWPNCLTTTEADRAWYRTHQFPLFAWSSQAQGFFTDRFAPDDRSNSEMVRVWYSDENFARLERARQLGERKGVSANTIALAYVLAQDFPTFALIGPRTPQELATSLEAQDVELTPEETRWLEEG